MASKSSALISLCLQLVLITFYSAGIASAGDSNKFRLKVISHKPCLSKGTPNEYIRFPDLSQAPVVEDPRRGPGCYLIDGPITVKQYLTGTVQVYNELKMSAQSAPATCSGADSSNCGGYGSCVYCDPCDVAEKISAKSSAMVQLEPKNGGKSFDCKRGVKPGVYTNMRLSFCLPTVEEAQKSNAFTDDDIQTYLGGGKMVFSTVYIFNSKANKWSKSDLLKYADPKSRYVIGCHKIVVRVYEDD